MVSFWVSMLSFGGVSQVVWCRLDSSLDIFAKLRSWPIIDTFLLTSSLGVCAALVRSLKFTKAMNKSVVVLYEVFSK